MLEAGRHFARTAVSGWVIFVAVVLAVALALLIEWLRIRQSRSGAQWRHGPRSTDAGLGLFDGTLDEDRHQLAHYRTDEADDYAYRGLSDVVDHRRGRGGAD